MVTPRQHFTFLFTDIERSSELWETHPQTMGRALAQHDDLLRRTFEEQGGHVFKTVGDAFCVAFGESWAAVRAALEGQRSLAHAAWEETGPLRVRMAVHQGEAELRDDDYFGPTLNRVARILGVGHGGQTLLSGVVAETVRKSLNDDVSLRDLGERRLKDLSQPEHIFQLVILDLPDSFPPLRSLEVLPNNLPAQVTSFVGREREMVEVKRLMPTTRLLTLTGMGGTGKTRLSLQAAADLLDQFPHGVWVVELALLSEEAQIPEAVISAVGIRGEPDRPPQTTLVEALRTRHLLLVLDNCEHLVAGCAQLATVLLRSCPQLKIITSSREPLSVEGETILSLAPLPIYDFWRNDPLRDIDKIAQYESVQLFVERAAAVRPGFHLEQENATLVAQICWRLDGIPLAIELAAARVKIVPLAEILNRLDDRFRLLTGGSRSALPRQQTLGALIDWSYDLLTAPEQMLLRRLAVFVGGRTLEMAEEVCAGGDLDRRDIFDLLCSLADKSLLLVETGKTGETRYTMLESIWDYADDKLIKHGEQAEYLRRHLDFFMRRVEEAEPHLYGSDQGEWLDKLAFDHSNLLRAVRTSLGSKETIEQGLRLAASATRYWEVRSYLTEGYQQFRELFAKAGDGVSPVVRAKAEFGAGRLSWCQERDPDALTHYQKAWDLYENLGQKEEAGLARAFVGFTEWNEGHLVEARQHLEEALARGEEIKSERLKATALSGLSSVMAHEGKLKEAREIKERCIQFFEKRGDRWIVSLITGSLAKVCLIAGDLAAARRYITEALAITRALRNNWVVPYAIEGVATICLQEGQSAKAVRLFGAASAHREALALDFSTPEKAEYEATIARMRQAMPEAEFKREWEEGRNLSFEAAVTLALEGFKGSGAST